ncbi:pyridoxamine 5'-phosphate oxidase family protein [Terricaulis sp.]|uniref:pyridoxamine 5'-phosphate oxidase family protein n=1 Tax=Terricaulis sp. TaxID=2768686 RepID=UPI003784D4F3
MLSSDKRDLIVSILNAANDLTIATLREDGYPQATAVSFVSDGLTIYFGTGAQAQKARNIARDNRVSISITDPYKAWNEIRGVSIGGRAVRLTDPNEMNKVGALMMTKFPQIQQYVQFGEAMEMALFRIDAEVFSILDYSQGFGHTELVSA